MSAVLHWLASQCSLLREYADFYAVCALIDNRFWLAKCWLGAKMVLAWMVDELNARRLRDW